MLKAKYDYLIVGAGLAGAVAANRLTAKGHSCLVVEKGDHVGGMCHTRVDSGIHVHEHGAHIFHTNSKDVWDYVTLFCEFKPFINSPLAKYHDELYNLPFNMNTFYRLFGTTTPEEARLVIRAEIVPCENPTNLEEYALATVGPTIYEKLIKHYTEKQWGRPCRSLPASTIKRLPLRFTYDNNYFDATYQGIPTEGYTTMIERMLDGCDIILNEDYLARKPFFDSIAERIVYTGRIDEFFDLKYGHLDFRSVAFKNVRLDVESYQGVAVVNHTGPDVPYTRTIEHRHFLGENGDCTIVSYEYPVPSGGIHQPCYPIEDERNLELLRKYKADAENIPRVTFFGRLAEYRYYDMDKIVERGLSLWK